MHDKIAAEIAELIRTNHPLRAAAARRMLDEAIKSPEHRSEALEKARRLLQEGMKAGNWHILQSAIDALHEDDAPVPPQEKSTPAQPPKKKAPKKKAKASRGKKKQRRKKKSR